MEKTARAIETFFIEVYDTISGFVWLVSLLISICSHWILWLYKLYNSIPFSNLSEPNLQLKEEMHVALFLPVSHTELNA